MTLSGRWQGGPIKSVFEPTRAGGPFDSTQDSENELACRLGDHGTDDRDEVLGSVRNLPHDEQGLLTMSFSVGDV